jgi:AcrR family transcriptional regulator
VDASRDLRRWRLPRGRHGLPRELVIRSQRERLLAAVVQVSAANGYASTSVADILEGAGVGRESFYELYDDKRDCLLSAHALLVDHLAAAVRSAYAEPGPWAERLGRALAAALEWFAADPAAAKVMLVELASVGPVSRSRFHEAFQCFTSLLEDGRDSSEPAPERPRAAELAVAACVARVREEVVRGRVAELPTLRPELTYELLVPFLGEEAARAAVE